MSPENPASPEPQTAAVVQADQQISDARMQLREPAHLHPSSLIFEAASHVRQFIIPAVVGLVGAAQGAIWGLWFAGIAFSGALGFTVFRYATLRYRVEGDEFIVTEGLIFRRVRSVPIRKIQNMDLVQNVLHRIFGVAEVNIETASGTKPEATLRVLTHDQIAQLREAIFSDPAAKLASETVGSESSLDEAVNDSYATGETVLATISVRQLLLAGLTSNRGFIILGIAFGFLYQFDILENFMPSFIDEDSYLRKIADRDFGEAIILDGKSVTEQDPFRAVLFVLGGFAVIFVTLKILGMVWYVLRFYGYRLSRSGDDLRISCGLFTRVSATVPRRRIQFMSVHRPYLMRKLGLATLRIETAGGAGNENENAATTVSRRWFLPVVDEARVPELLAELRPGLRWQPELVTWQGVSPRTSKRLMRSALIGSLIAAAIGIAITRPWGWTAGVALYPVLLWFAIKKSRARRYSSLDWGVAYQSGLLTHKLSFAFFDRIQSLRFVQSPFDRRWEMARLEIDTAASGPAEHLIEIEYLEESFASEQFQRLTHAASMHSPAWQ